HASRDATTISPLISTFILLLRPPPHFTLFPYTTLFRSEHASQDNASQPHWILPRGRVAAMVSAHSTAVEAEIRRLSADLCFDGRDRKSTRLNSSHQIISYAVFCLTKKKE